jgi:hypothetical protein
MTEFNQLLCAPSANTRIETLQLGRERQPLLKIDDCMAGVDELRQRAITANNFAKADTHYPGVRMLIDPMYSLAIAKVYKQYIENFFGLNVQKIKKIVSAYSIVTLPPQQLNILQRIPHFDAPTQNSLAMVHYLCNASTSGTCFYRHRETGYEFINSERREGYVKTIEQQFSEPAVRPSGYICGDTAEYEVIASFEAVYNRLIMYRGSSLHSGLITPAYNFDPSPETGRLTIASFIEFYDEQ